MYLRPMFEQELTSDIETAWEKLVQRDAASIYTSLPFVRALADDWKVISNDLGPKLLVAGNQKAGIKQLYMPFFCRQLHFSGSLSEADEVLSALQKNYARGQLNLPLELKQFQPVRKTYQTIDHELRLNTLAKRKIKQAKKHQIAVAETTKRDQIIQIITEELCKKVPEINKQSMERMSALCSHLDANKQLICLGVFQNGVLEGGLLLATDARSTYYLKGACRHGVRDAGGMFLAMSTAIEASLSQQKRFDFGGSSVPSVRQFNLHFGASDQVYFQYTWDQSPRWYRVARSIKKCLGL